MTIASTDSHEFNIDQICRLAWLTSGLAHEDQVLTSGQYQMARDFLELEVRKLSNYGVQARFLTFYNLTLTADVYKYTLGSSVLDVVGDGMYIPAGEDVDRSSQETPVRLVRSEEWHRLSAKDTTSSVPFLMYPHREFATPQLWIWPIPTEAGTIRVSVQRMIADSVNGENTVDLEANWTNMLVNAVASRLAGSKLLDQKSQALFLKSRGELSEAMEFSTERGPIQLEPELSSQWRAR